MRSWLGLAAVVGLLVGCSTTFQELHYFRSKVKTPEAVPNYYRLTVEGMTLLSSSRYVSGYFDEETLNTYFNEFSQPEGGTLRHGAPAAPDTGMAERVEPLAASLKGKNLIMILSSNSDEVATQIGALASSKQFTASLAGLIARDAYLSAGNAERRLAVDQSRAKALASFASQLLAAIPSGATTSTMEQQLLALANAVAADLGYQGTFATVDAVAQWLDFNRGRLVQGER